MRDRMTGRAETRLDTGQGIARGSERNGEGTYYYGILDWEGGFVLALLFAIIPQRQAKTTVTYIAS